MRTSKMAFVPSILCQLRRRVHLSAAFCPLDLRIIGVAAALLTSACQPLEKLPQDAQVPTDTLAELVYELLQGEMYGYRGELPEAFEHYYQASLKTDDPEIAYRSTEIGIWMEDYARAMRAAKRWQEVLPDDPRPWRILGAIHAAQGQVDEAIKAYLEALAVRTLPLTFSMEAVKNSLSISAAQPYRLDIFRELVGYYPHEPQSYLNIAEAAKEAGHLEEALFAADETLKRTGYWALPMRVKVDSLRLLGRDDEAVKALWEGVEQAIRVQEQLPLWRRLVNLLGELGRVEEAMEALQPLLEEEPDNPHWQLKRGTLSLALQDWEQSREAFVDLSQNPNSLVRDEPASFNYSVAAYYLGLLAEHDNRFVTAMNYYYKVEERDYLGVDQYFRKARLRIAKLLWQVGRIDRARLHLRISRARSGDDENILHLYIAEADMLYGDEQYQAGYDLLSEALRRYSRDSLLLYSRALHAERLGRLDQVEADLGLVLAADPDDARALNALGYTWVDHGVNLEQGLAHIQRAHEQLPEDAAILDSMGWAYYRLGDLKRAEHYLRRAQNLLPNGEITAHLVEVLWQQGRHEEAVRLYQEAAEELPDDEFLERVAQRFSL